MKISNRFIFPLLLIFCTLSSSLQAKGDTTSLKSKLEKAKLLVQSKPDSALLLFEQGMKESRKTGEMTLYAEFCYRLSMLSAVRNDFEKALHLADSAVKYSGSLPGEMVASMYNLQGNIRMQTGQYEPAANCYLKCVALAEKQKNERLLLMVYSNLSMLFLNLIQPDKALEYGQKQLNMARTLKNDDEVAYACSSINDIFSQTHQADSMEKYVGIMEKACKNTQDPELPLMLANAKGAMYNGKKQYKMAIPHFLRAVELNRQMGDSNGMMRASINVGLAYVKDKQGKNAVAFLKPAVEKSKRWGEKMLEREATKELAEAYFLAGDFQNAYKTQLDYQLLSDIALNEKSHENIQKLEAQYQSEKKAADIQRLEKEKAIQANAAESSRNQRNTVFLASLALLGFGLFLGNRYMARRKLANQKEVLEGRIRLSSDLHDDVGATLSSISIYTEAIKNKLRQQDYERVQELVEKIGDHARETVSTLGDIVWNLNPINDSAERLFLRMESTASLLLSAQNARLEFEADPQLLDFDFSLEAKQNLYLMFKETVNNTVKYSGANLLKISIKKDQQHLGLHMADNGKGFNVEEKSTGNGLANIHRRAQALGGKAEISSSGNGTVTHIQFPLRFLGKP